MVNVERQRESLETLKLINAAITGLRLYPEQSVKVKDVTEKAYQGVKAFLRKHELLHLSLQDGTHRLYGESVDKRTEEHLQLLTFHGQFQKIGLNELVLRKGFDRKIFKKIVSVFSATPEQIKKAGGGRAFVEEKGLRGNFPEQYDPLKDAEEEKKRKEKVEQVLQELSQGGVRREYILYLLGKNKDGKVGKELQQIFQTPEKTVYIIAAATYSLLQRLQKDNIVATSRVFALMVEKIASFLEEKQYAEIATMVADLLAPHLGEADVLMFVCQDFPTPFGTFFYDAQLKVTDTNILNNLVAWMEEQQENGGEGDKKLIPQLKLVYNAYEKLIASPRGKQLQAASETQEILEKTEAGRRGKRMQAGVTGLAKGDLEGLRNDDVRLNLPVTLEKLIANEKEPLAAAIIQNMVNGLKDKEDSLRPFLGQSIGAVAVKLAAKERWDWLEKLTPVCLAWIREAEVADRSYENYVVALQKMMSHAWNSENDDLAERILNVFFHIRSGGLEKPEAIRSLVGHVQDKGVDRAILQSYLERCFVKPVDEMICRKLSMQGPVAARFMLDILLASESRSERIRLLKILSGMTIQLPPVLLERLSEPMPWFGKRNLIRLLAETGSEKDGEAVLEYVAHEDLRVGQEALSCILRIGDASTQHYLLQVLPTVSVSFKKQVVKALRRVADENVVSPLVELLDECRLYTGRQKKDLVIEICNTLGASKSVSALSVLQEITERRERQYGKESASAAEQAIAYIQENNKTESTLDEVLPDEEEQDDETRDSTGEAVSAYECVSSLPDEKQVYTFMQEGQQEAAKRLLVELIEKAAGLRQFDNAEALRLRLIDIDPMALSDIIKAAELIEEIKSASIDQDHIIIWSDLYDMLGTEEFNTFYHALKHESYSSETSIVKQGDMQWRLFFINKGRVKLYYQDDEDETLVKTLGPGQVFGGSSFFDDSVWTLSAACLGAVELSILAMDNIEEWGEVYPSLEYKLQKFCARFDLVSEFFMTSGADRREDQRRALSGDIDLIMLDDQGGASGNVLRGEGSDVSIGGISFVSRISQRKHARALLGRSVEVSSTVPGQDEPELAVRGIVVAVRSQHSADMGRSVHVRFDYPITQEKLQSLIEKS